MKYLIDDVLHGSMEDTETFCGIVLADGVAPWLGDAVPAVCDECAIADHKAAVEQAEQLMKERSWSAILGPCGVHLVAAGPRDIMRIALRPLAPGNRIVTPTAEQLVALLVSRDQCDKCTPGVPDKKFWPKGQI